MNELQESLEQTDNEPKLKNEPEEYIPDVDIEELREFVKRSKRQENLGVAGLSLGTGSILAELIKLWLDLDLAKTAHLPLPEQQVIAYGVAFATSVLVTIGSLASMASQDSAEIRRAENKLWDLTQSLNSNYDPEKPKRDTFRLEETEDPSNDGDEVLTLRQLMQDKRKNDDN